MYVKAQKILIVSTTWLGDGVITVPAISGLRSLFPDAHIAILARDTIADLFRAVPAVDEIIPFVKKGGAGKPGTILKTAGLLRKRSFDLVVMFPRSLGTALMCCIARIPLRIGFKTGLRGMFLTEPIREDRRVRSVHQMHYYEKLISPLGDARFPELPVLVLPDRERQWARAYLHSRCGDTRAPLVGINPGSTYGEAKQWPVERFAELSRKLSEKHGCKVIIFGDAAASVQAKTINRALDGRALDVTGRTTILQLAALLSCCTVLVTNDTGPMHVACAVQTPVVAIFGSTDPIATGPLGDKATILRDKLPCSPCLRRTCPEGHLRCMKNVPVENAVNAVLQQLQDYPPSAMETYMI